MRRRDLRRSQSALSVSTQGGGGYLRGMHIEWGWVPTDLPSHVTTI